jgi:hypothetical protein
MNPGVVESQYPGENKAYTLSGSGKPSAFVKTNHVFRIELFSQSESFLITRRIILSKPKIVIKRAMSCRFFRV